MQSPPKDPRRPDSPFGPPIKQRPSRDPVPIIIGCVVAFLVALIVILAFTPLSPFRSGSSTGEVVFDAPGIGRGVTEEFPPLPDHLSAVSDYVVFESDRQEIGSITINIPLTSNISSENGLRFYSFINGA